MSQNKIRIVSLYFFVICVLLTVSSVHGQLLINEVEADPGNQQNDSCQYVELRGQPGATVAANTWFVAIDSDSAFPGALNVAVNIGGRVVGTNGTISIVNTFGSTCPNRDFGSSTTLVTYSSPIRIGGGNILVGSENFVILNTTATLSAGQDADTDDDGVLNFSATFVDAVSIIINPDEQYVYPANSPIVNTPFTDVPDAIIRFNGNNSPFSADAYYWAEVAETPDEAVQLLAPFSPNFPQGGLLTPGSNNLPAASRIPVADFDGDGRTDLSTFRPSEGIWYSNRSTAGFSAVRWGLSGDRPVPGDYDGDNKADYAVWRPSDISTDADFYILNSSNSTLSALSHGSTGDIPVTGDFDGDNKNDIVVWRPSTGEWFLWETSTLATRTALFGSPGDVPFAMDSDGDGKSNLTVYRALDRIWYIAKPTGVPAQNFDATVWGFSTDIKVPADYDGDGKDDIAVFRPSDGVWYIRRSSDSLVTYTAFGTAGDVPVAGDYDGDGKDDIAVFRNVGGSGTWYLNRSTSGFSTQVFGFGDDKPIPSFYRP